MLACASTARTWPELVSALGPPRGGDGRLVVYRSLGSQDMTFRPVVSLDGTELGDFRVGRFRWIDLAPGTHGLALRSAGREDSPGDRPASPPVEVTIVAGETRYVRVRVAVETEAIVVTLVESDPEDAERALTDAVREDVD